jgi:hypothetical protein
MRFRIRIMMITLAILPLVDTLALQKWLAHRFVAIDRKRLDA